YSPDDITHVKPILQRVRLGIPDRKVPASLDEVRTKIERAYTEEFQGEQDKSFLAWYRMDVAEFKREGRNFFGESLFGQYCQRLEQTTLKCELLLAGFDEKRLGHLFTVTDPGKVMLFDDVGFWAIGSGQRNALSSLFSCSFNIRKSLHEGIYHVCAAKFMSEGAQGVGNETAGLLCRRNDYYTKIEIKEITQEFITEIRRIWNDEGKPRLPKSTVGIVDSAVRSGKTVFLG
ncbi:MAG: hypothetical protein LAO04_23070, partial [Acidobacteriia bacterium]|nr:hypothetical protein [Terriglobia bacterium]